MQFHKIGRASVRELGSHQCWPIGNLHRVVCHAVVYRLEPSIDEGGLVPVTRAERVSRRIQPLIDRVLGDIEQARDLLRSLMFDEQVETRALLLGQAVPTIFVFRWVRPRIIHSPTLVTK